MSSVLEFIHGNIFEAEVVALVNPVNTVGVMSKGLALQFSKSFHEILPAYKDACKTGELVTGKVQVIELPRLAGMQGPKYVINFPTKQHWRNGSKIEFVQTGLHSLRKEIARHEIESIAIPSLGCGLGGLTWSDVRTEIESALGELTEVQIVVYEPA